MKKRIWITLITLVTAFCLALNVSACSKDDNQGDTGGGSQIEQDGNQGDTDGENTPSHSHSATLVSAKSASCTESGNIAYYVCSCGKWFSDGNATTEIIDHNSVILKATGHSYSSLWTYNDTQHWHAATCQHTSEKSEVANHIFENGVCKVCKYEQPKTTVEITAIYLNKTSLSLYVDDSETLVETILPVNATESVTWISTAPSVATVENGTVTAVSTGTATIIVSSPGGKTATCEVTVTENTYGCTFKKFGNGYAVVGYTGTATTVTVPSTYQGEPVVAIGTVSNYGDPLDGFAYCSNIESVIIPSSVTTIKPYAFYNCTSLKELIIPDSVNSLGYNMLYNCNRLQKLSLSFANFELYQLFDYLSLNATNSSAVPSSLKELIITGGSTIAEAAFYGCSSLTSVTIGDGVKKIGEQAFEYCNGLTSVTIPNSVTSIGWAAFYGCNKLESMTIPFVGASQDGTSNTHFGYIWGVESYEYNSATLPSSLKTVIVTGGARIGSSAFYGCNGLTSVTIGDGVTSIGQYAFHDCSSLTSITIPDSVTSIGQCAFQACSSLTSVTIPNSVTSIGSYAFNNCSSLTSITIPNSVTSIGWAAFNNCYKLTSVVFKNPNGWWRSSSSSGSSGTAITGLDNPATAATYLKDTYNNYYWKRS